MVTFCSVLCLNVIIYTVAMLFICGWGRGEVMRAVGQLVDSIVRRGGQISWLLPLVTSVQSLFHCELGSKG